MTTISPHVTRGTGTILTAAVYNTDHNNHITNASNLNSDKIEVSGSVAAGELAAFVDTTGETVEGAGISAADIGDVSGPGASNSTDGNFAMWEDGDGTELTDDGFFPAADSDVWEATPGAVLTTDKLSSGVDPVALTETSGDIPVDWETFQHATVTIDENSELNNPTNGIPGQFKTIIIQGSDGTPRTLTFGNQFGGEVPTITDIDNAQWYMLTIFCVTTTHFLISAIDASAP